MKKEVKDAIAAEKAAAQNTTDIDIQLPKGRPTDPNSERQKRLAQQEANKIANGGMLTRGRKPDPNSANYKKALERRQREEAMRTRIINAVKVAGVKPAEDEHVVTAVNTDGSIEIKIKKATGEEQAIKTMTAEEVEAAQA